MRARGLVPMHMEVVPAEREVRGYQRIMLDVHVCYLDRRDAASRTVIHTRMGREAGGRSVKERLVEQALSLWPTGASTGMADNRPSGSVTEQR